MPKTLTSAIGAVRRATGQLRAVAYLRVSTEEQTKGNGIAYTGRRVLRHIEKKAWAYVDTYSDEGLTGTLEAFERDELSRLMDDARKSPRPFDVVVVYEERAMGRRDRAFWPWVWELQDLGVFVAIVKGDYDNTTDEGRSRMRKAQDKAEDERITIRDRTNGGRDERALDGGYVGGKVPYGYRKEGPRKERVLVVDECDDPQPCATMHEADTLRRARAIYADPEQGDSNWRKTAMLMNADGYTTRSGKPWTHNNLKARVMSPTVLEARQIFRNPEGQNTTVDLDGNPAFGETVVIELDPIFTEAEIRELEEAVKRRPARATAQGGRVYTLSKRMISPCGSYYTGIGRTSNGERHYRCSGTEGCTCSRVDADAAEAYVWNQVSQFLGSEERLKVLVEEHVGSTRNRNVDFASRIAELDQQIKTLRRTISITTAMTVRQAVESGAEDSEAESQAAEAVRPLQSELKELEGLRNEAAAWQQEVSEAGQRAKDLQALARTAHHRLERLTPAQQAEFLALLEIKVTITGEVPQGRQGSPCSLTRWFHEAKRTVPTLTDEAWAKVEPLMTVQYRTLQPRLILEGLLYKARTGCRWAELPSEYGSQRGIQTQLNRWQRSGLWEEIMDALEGVPGTPAFSQDLTPPMVLTGELVPELLLDANSHLDERSRSASCPRVSFKFQIGLAA